MPTTLRQMLSNIAIRFLYRINCDFWKIACRSQRPFELSSFPSTIQNSLQPPARPTPESYLNRREAPTLEMARLLICSAQHTPSFARTSATAIAAHRCSNDLGHRWAAIAVADVRAKLGVCCAEQISNRAISSVGASRRFKYDSGVGRAGGWSEFWIVEGKELSSKGR